MKKQGFAMVTVLFLVAVVGMMLVAHYLTTNIDLSVVRSSRKQSNAFYAAEAAANMRGNELYKMFEDQNRPFGIPVSDSSLACSGNNYGAGDFGCQSPNLFADRRVVSYLTEATGSNQFLPLSSGLFKGLSAQTYRYTVYGESYQDDPNVPEAQVEVAYEVKVIPLFQFAAFYESDLEINPGDDMTIQGRVHTNGDLYTVPFPGKTLTLNGSTSAAGKLLGKRKEDNQTCQQATVIVVGRVLPCKNSYSNQDLAPFGDDLRQNADNLITPGMGSLARDPSAPFYSGADLRIVLNLDANGVATGIEVQNPDGSPNTIKTSRLNSCAGDTDRDNVRDEGVVGVSDSFYNNRDETRVTMLEVDIAALSDCIATTGTGLVDGGIGDSSGGGLLLHLSVDGPDSASINNYGVRISHAEELHAQVKGLSVASDQAIYSWGDVNAVNRRPVALMGDSVNVLSSAWTDLDPVTGEDGSRALMTQRVANDTTVNAAIVSGVNETVGGDYSGGLENLVRLSENYDGKQLNIEGSFVSLGATQHTDSPWVAPIQEKVYWYPQRNFTFDSSFMDTAGLPPKTPSVVLMTQTTYRRDFSRDF